MTYLLLQDSPAMLYSYVFECSGEVVGVSLGLDEASCDVRCGVDVSDVSGACSSDVEL